MTEYAYDPATDLKIERVVDVPVPLVWKAWTTPDLVKQWFCPRPWGISDSVLELRPGGRFFTMVRSPDNEAFPNESCVLEVVEGRRIVWTDALHAGLEHLRRGRSPRVLTPHAGEFRAVFSKLASALDADRFAARAGGRVRKSGGLPAERECARSDCRT